MKKKILPLDIARPRSKFPVRISRNVHRHFETTFLHLKLGSEKEQLIVSLFPSASFVK